MAVSENSPRTIRQQAERERFEVVIEAMKADVLNASLQGVINMTMRALYDLQIDDMACDYRTKCFVQKISWPDAAEEADHARRTFTDLLRGKSTPTGQFMADALKARGMSINELIAHYAVQRYTPRVDYYAMTPSDRNRVFLDIIEASARDNAQVARTTRVISRCGRSFLIMAVAHMVYKFAEDTSESATYTLQGKSETVAGLECGPGTKPCVEDHEFAKGAVDAHGIDFLWD